MVRTIILAIALLAGALIPGGQASTLRSRKMHARNAGPVDSFRKNFGWPGHQFPNDRWGAVMDSEAAEEAAAEAATATIVRPNLGTAPVNIEPSPVASNPASLISGFSVISTVPQAVPTSSVVIGDISVSNATSSPSSLSAPKTTSQLLSPLVSTKKPSPSVSPISSSSVQTPSAPPSSVHKQQPSSIPPSVTPSTPPSSQAPPPSSSPASKPSSSPPAQPPSTPSSAPVSIGSGGGSSNQGNQGQSSDNSGFSSSGGTSPSDIQAYLTGHNNARAQHGAAPLTYSQSLAAKAQQWANGCLFQHSGGTLGPFGENLAAGTGNFGIAQAIGAWVAEASQYNPNDPVPSHFTQVVWKSTTEVGCAVQSCSNIFPGDGVAQYYVCEYSPAGNVIGEFA
ncbi:hypothetical protein Clacol_003189 [Clathrus columnatus]|uniref:SCP domain-containing protein n=1 Tax=Clathrus columnatus TaxID=1419009 RepID=A0AAV5A8I7_9AGAM|nr:hypothetical protein Clacol_003189 [Clathrus columnatus]